MKKILVFLMLFNLAMAREFDREKLNDYLNLLESNKKIMGSISISEGGQEVFNRSIGYVDIASKMKANRETKYKIGSLTKTFTSVAILQLIEEGSLTFDTKLSEYYPQVPKSNLITIEHMLYHRTGLFNFTMKEDFPVWQLKDRSEEEIIEVIIENEALFNPGEGTAYSNSNYYLLGRILEKVEGKEYSEIIEERIIDKIGLEDTYVEVETDIQDNEAYSYDLGAASWVKTPIAAMSVPGGAGNMVSTPTEINEFFYSLFNGELISDKSLEQMTTLVDGFGMGIFGMDPILAGSYGHGGGIDSFVTMPLFYPVENVGISLNTNGATVQPFEVLGNIKKIYYGEEFELPVYEKAKPLLEEDVDNLVGDYINADNTKDSIEISFSDKNLMAAFSSGMVSPLRPEGESFAIGPYGFRVEFTEEGLITSGFGEVNTYVKK